MAKDKFKTVINIDATIISFSDLLTKTEKFKKTNKIISANRFELPEFQRSFVWKKEQISRLIDDIKAEGELYLGNIVTASAKDGFDYLIDGQQRLVTLSILCLVLKNKTKNIDLNNKIDKLLYKNEKEPRITFSKNKLNSFYKKIFNSKEVNSVDESQKFIERAINIIKKELSFLNTDKEISSFLEKIKNINLVIIKCLDFSELSKLFVGLNSTGIELSQVELVKGYLHGGIDQLKKSKRKIIIGKWDYLEKLFENNNIFWFNQFLRHQWYLEGGYITSSKLSNKINKEKIKKNEKIFFEYIDNLKRDANIYIKLRNDKSRDLDFPRKTRNDLARELHSILENIYILDLQQIYPVILALYNFGKIKKEYHKNGSSFRDFSKLWSFLFLAKYSKINPSSYERLFAKLCFDVSKKDLNYKSFKKILSKFFKDLKPKVASSKKRFIKELSENYRDNEDKLTKTILYDFYDKEEKYKLNKFEIEHILPQGKKGQGSFKKLTYIQEYEYDNLRGYIYRLGNLSILEKELNAPAKDQGWVKKKQLYKKSCYDENKKISKNYNFSSAKEIVKSIKRRGKYLAAEIFNTYIKKLQT